MQKMFLPELLEFLYDCFDSRTKDFLFERLSREELKKVKSKGKIRNFIERARLEDIIILLSKINCGVGLVIWDREKEKRERVSDILIAQNEIDPKDLTRYIVRAKIFSTMGIEIIRGLQVTTKASFSPNWSVNRKYLELKKEKLSWVPERNISNNLEAKRNYKWHVETISTALKLSPLLEHYKITVLQFQILLFLQLSPNGATIESVDKELLCPRGFKAMLVKLYKMNMIEYNPLDRSIIEIGINGLVVVDAIISKFP